MSAVSDKRCECGCGEYTLIAGQTRPARGMFKGQPNRFLRGHHRRARGVPACGYTVDEVTGCWVWGLCLDDKGYGQSRRRRAHIVMWEQAHGPVPAGLELDHLCRNRACCNPDHLEPVTHAENMRRASTVKLTVGQVRAIRADGRSQRAIAAEYGIEQTTVSAIKRGATWSDV